VRRPQVMIAASRFAEPRQQLAKTRISCCNHLCNRI
jgi:hypothetical protein